MPIVENDSMVFLLGKKKKNDSDVYQIHENISNIRNKVEFLQVIISQRDNAIPDKRALFSLAIKKALLEMGEPTYDQVLCDLYFEYHCNLADCYEHPEYLKAILKEMFGNAHKVIVELIKEQLEELNKQTPIPELLSIISR